MECPKCNERMVSKGKDNSFDFGKKPKKKYDREVFWCKKDDVWISIEIPSMK